MRFNINDYVRVKQGVILEEFREHTPDWAGRITEISQGDEELFYGLALDALSLEQLPEWYLNECDENGLDFTVYFFGEADLEPAERRDTDEQYKAALEKINEIYFPDDDEILVAQLKTWTLEFAQSPQFESLNAEDQIASNFLIELFAKETYLYTLALPKEWDESHVEEICLDIFPLKLSSDIQEYEQTGRVLLAFFAFLQDKKYLENARGMHQMMEKITPQMIARAKDPNNWGKAKKIAMNASGYLNDIMLPKEEPSRYRPTRENPFKNISRNQIVKVKYPDGSIREGKFKRLEDELRAGKCRLID